MHTYIHALLPQLWNLDGGVPLTPRVAAAATFEHLITDRFRVDAPRVLPAPWGYASEDGEDGKGQAASQLLDNGVYLARVPAWKDEDGAARG